jgi:hypothetical protein
VAMLLSELYGSDSALLSAAAVVLDQALSEL